MASVAISQKSGSPNSFSRSQNGRTPDDQTLRALFPKLRAWRSYSPGYTVSYSSSRSAARSPHIFCGKRERLGLEQNDS